MKSSASKSKPFQRQNFGEVRRKERLSRSKLKQAFLIDSDADLVRLMKSSVSEPGLINV